MHLLGHDNIKSGNGKDESVQEPEDNAEAPDAPMVPGLQPPSPRPMVHDPLDRQENEPQQLTAAELARWVIQLCKLCLQYKALHAFPCTPQPFDVLQQPCQLFVRGLQVKAKNRPCCPYSR